MMSRRVVALPTGAAGEAMLRDLAAGIDEPRHGRRGN